MMKKRLISLTLALLMVLSMTACGAKPTPTEAPTEAPTEPENALALGTVENGTYTNTYAGIGCDLDSSWTIYTVDELQELPDVTQQMVEGTELEALMANVTQFTDIFAENVDLLATMNVLFQKLEMSQRLAYAVMDEKAVLEATLTQKDIMFEAYANAGIYAESMEIVTVTFLGEEHYALRTVAESQGVPYYILQVFDFWLGKYSMTITFSSYVEDTTEDVLALFYAVE